MNKNSLFSSQGSFLIGVDTEKKNEMSLIDLVKAEKEAAGITSTLKYDLNGDGAVDSKDIVIIKKKLLGVK